MSDVTDVLANESVHRSNTRTRLSYSAIFIVLLCAGWYCVAGTTMAPSGVPGDFSCTYMAGSLVREGHLRTLYDVETQARWWRTHISAEGALVPYVRPPFYALLVSPFTTVSLKTLFRINILVFGGLLLASWYWIGRRLGEEAIVLAAMFWPAPLGTAAGQDCALMLALVIVSYRLFLNGRDGPAGIVLGMGLFKYHIICLMGPAMLLSRRRKMFIAFALVALILLIFSFVLLGPSGSEAYAKLIFRKDLDGLYPSLHLMPNLNGLLENLGLNSTRAQLPLCVITIFLVGVAAWRAPWWRSMAASIAGSILIIPHVFLYDITTLLLGLVLALKCSRSRMTRFMAAWLCLPVVFLGNVYGSPWAAAMPLSLLLFVSALVRESMLWRHTNVTSDYSRAATAESAASVV